MEGSDGLPRDNQQPIEHSSKCKSKILVTCPSNLR